MEPNGPDAAERTCLLCGADADLTAEHIVPQALWRRFDVDPDREDLAVFGTTLCERHNQATAALHQRKEMLDLINTGEPLTRRSLLHLGDWTVWVTLLLGLSRGSGVLGEGVSRDALLRRFDAGSGGTPGGVRVYAARVSEYMERRDPPMISYSLALCEDSRVLLDAQGAPVGFSAREGPISASESIGLGKIALLVVGRTYTSGEHHLQRLDQAAALVGLERVLPLPGALPGLEPRPVSMADVGNLFTVIPFGADMSLMPENLRVFAPPE